MQLLITFVVTILLFGLLVFIHEFGHFWVAKRSGVIVEEFAFGFGPKLLAYRFRGTLYRINLFPLGGYVKMLGDQDGSSFMRYSEKDYPKKDREFVLSELEKVGLAKQDSDYYELSKYIYSVREKYSETDYKKFLAYLAYEYIPQHPGNFDNKPISVRMMIIIAGVVMNFLLGAVLFYILFQFSSYTVDLTKLGDPKFIGAEVSSPPILFEVYGEANEDLEGSVILKANGETINTSEEFFTILDQNYNQEINLFVFSGKGYQEQKLVLDGDGIASNFDQDVIDRVLILNIADGSAAAKAGLMNGDVLLRFAGTELNSPDQLKQLLDEYRGKKVKIQYVNSAGEKATTQLNLPNPPQGEPILGAVPVENTPFINNALRLNYEDFKLGSGFAHALNIMLYNVSGLGELISQSVQQKSIEPVSSGVGSIVAVFDVTFYLVQVDDFRNIINLAGMLSVTLAFMNILPIPLFDGGHLLFLFIEKFRGKPLAPSTQENIGKVVFILLIGLTILVMLKDVFQLDWPMRIFGMVSSIFS